ncbi:hypothetical protein JXB28_02825 [Candidatus Woesearchaeota archaeon]|nr:hypothetical protein [Candidatus Woesearchaeota archaeon]
MSLATQEEKDKFLQEASRHLDIDKWGDFLLRWGKALETYSTPVSILEGTGYDNEFKVNFSGKDWGFVRLIPGSGWNMRRALMAKQPPFFPAKNIEEYDAKLVLNDEVQGKCFMCENIAQGIDAKDNPSIDNVVFELGKYFITPGRYPRDPGHCLWVPVDHDDNSKRVVPQEGNKLYIPEEGKTRGALITPQELEAIVKFCQENHFIAARNHVLDGMSVPAHDHWHLHIIDLYSYDLAPHVLDQANSWTLTKGVYIPKNTPFDGLVITQDASGFSGMACNVINNLEKDNQVFTLLIYKDRIHISPRKNIHDHRRIQIGAEMQIHSLDDPNPGEAINRIKQYVPMQNEFNWQQYLDYSD